MQMQAAVFRKVHAPLTIEFGRDRQTHQPRSAGAHGGHGCVPQRSPRRGWPLAVHAGSADRAGARGRRGGGGGRAEVTSGGAAAIMWWRVSRASAGTVHNVSGATRTSGGGIVTRPEPAPPRLSQRGVPSGSSAASPATPSGCAPRELSGEDRPRLAPRPRRPGGLWRVDRGRGRAENLRLAAGQTVAVFGCGGVGSRSCRARASAARGRSSLLTCSSPSWRWPAAWARPMP